MGNLCGGKVKEELKPIKMLLLGSGESGKSTVFTQVKILLSGSPDFSDEDMAHYTSSVYYNVLQSVAKLSEYCINQKIPFKNEANETAANEIINLMETNNSLLITAKDVYNEQLAKKVKELWNDDNVRNQFEKRYECQFHIPDGAMHFLKDLDRIDPPKYRPSNEDILHCRRKTTGIVQVQFKNGEALFKLIDVGGQRSERKKWKSVFQQVDVLIYVASLGDYDLLCYEDDTTNRLVESLDLFEEHMNSAFKDIPIMLFLNKTDIFKKKLSDGKTTLEQFFPDYKGGSDFDAASKYIENKFMEKLQENKDRVHVHYTCATSADSIRQVFDEVKNFVLNNPVKVHEPM
jgi:guanine nucleotide-binding protein G(i) subunit alpha